MESLKQIATAPDAPAPLRAIAERVEAGEFTWQDVEDGHLCADADFLAAIDATIEQRKVPERDLDENLGEDAGYTYVPEFTRGTHTGWRTSRDEEQDGGFMETV